MPKFIDNKGTWIFEYDPTVPVEQRPSDNQLRYLRLLWKDRPGFPNPRTFAEASEMIEAQKLANKLARRKANAGITPEIQADPADQENAYPLHDVGLLPTGQVAGAGVLGQS